MKLFSATSKPNYRESEAYIKHVTAVAETLGTAINMLKDLPKLIPILK